MERINIIVNRKTVATYYVPAGMTASEFGTDAVVAAIQRYDTPNVCWDYAK